VILHAFYVVAYTDHYTFWAWYYVSAVIAAGLTGSYWVEWIAGRTAKFVPENIAYALASMAIILLLSLGAARAWLKGIGPIGLGPVVIDVQINSYRWPDEVAQWMKTNLPPGSAVYAFDYPGAIAFYSDLRVLPMDGLVNDYEYNEELLALGVNRYLCRYRVSPLDRCTCCRRILLSEPGILSAAPMMCGTTRSGICAVRHHRGKRLKIDSGMARTAAIIQRQNQGV
jgi:DNA-directed RNA polymerase subunit N (RpoN/RPB10)